MKFERFITLTGAAPWLAQPNVDTDVIIRIERLTALSRNQLGPYCLESLRYRPDGAEDPGFVLNQAPFRSAPILLAGDNFGCGSSREGAVWALQEAGLRCVIAPSFGDIFYSNCFQNGILPIRLPAAQVASLGAACSHGAPLTVDLQQQVLSLPGAEPISFTVDGRRREALLNGLDDIGLTLQDDHMVREWQQRDRSARPWVWSV
jgi:3-isopropylmalate/(R)-2-methylmalate dehydratase small subunit